jgi:hypothetical protein
MAESLGLKHVSEGAVGIVVGRLMVLTNALVQAIVRSERSGSGRGTARVSRPAHVDVPAWVAPWYDPIQAPKHPWVHAKLHV